MFEPLRSETDQTGLELRKSFPGKAYEDRAQRVLLRRGLRSGRLVALLSRGQVIAHVNGNHFVRPLKVFEEQGVKWVRIYDPARGYYDQLLDSFITRTGANNQMVLILGP